MNFEDGVVRQVRIASTERRSDAHGARVDADGESQRFHALQPISDSSSTANVRSGPATPTVPALPVHRLARTLSRLRRLGRRSRTPRLARGCAGVRRPSDASPAEDAGPPGRSPARVTSTPIAGAASALRPRRWLPTPDARRLVATRIQPRRAARAPPPRTLHGRFSLSRAARARRLADRHRRRATAATIRARREGASTKRSWCSTSRCGCEKLLVRKPGVDVVHDAAHRRRSFRSRSAPRSPIVRARICSCRFTPTRAAAPRRARRRDLLPELRLEPRGRGGRGARERDVRPDDAQPARHREGDRAQQQAGRVARLRRRWCSDRWSIGCGSEQGRCATSASSRRRSWC